MLTKIEEKPGVANVAGDDIEPAYDGILGEPSKQQQSDEDNSDPFFNTRFHAQRRQALRRQNERDQRLRIVLALPAPPVDGGDRDVDLNGKRRYGTGAQEILDGFDNR